MNLKHFALSEFDCSHTGENQMDSAFLELLDKLRDVCNFPFHITSGYRSPKHPIEAKKTSPGTHSQGIAADIAVFNAQQRYTILKKAIELGFVGIGVADSFIHVDTRQGYPLVWTY